MADVTYNTASFPSLVRTLKVLTSGGDPESHSGRLPLILLGYKERDAAERSLWDMARNIGITVEKVGERPGAGGNPVEIWVGRPSHVYDNQASLHVSWAIHSDAD